MVKFSRSTHRFVRVCVCVYCTRVIGGVINVMAHFHHVYVCL